MANVQSELTPVNIGVENHFYRLPELNDVEFALVIKTANAMPEHSQTVVRNFVKHFTAYTRINKRLSGVLERNAFARQALDLYRSNIEENWHSQIEGNAIPILDAIRAGDIAFYATSRDAIDFLHFIAVQHLRTKKLRASQHDLQNNLGCDLGKVWQITSHFYAATLGSNLFIRRFDDPMTLIVNNTDVGLLTGDQPVVNLYAHTPRASRDLAIYYPVSPIHAILVGNLDDDVPRPKWEIDAQQVSKLNALMRRESYKMVFGRSEQDFGK